MKSTIYYLFWAIIICSPFTINSQDLIERTQQEIKHLSSSDVVPNNLAKLVDKAKSNSREKPEGIDFITLQTKDKIQTKKMILLK